MPYAAFNNNPIYFIDPFGPKADDPKAGGKGGKKEKTKKKKTAADRQKSKKGEWYLNGDALRVIILEDA